MDPVSFNATINFERLMWYGAGLQMVQRRPTYFAPEMVRLSDGFVPEKPD